MFVNSLLCCGRAARDLLGKDASGENFKTANFGFIVCLVIESRDRKFVGNENAASCILNFPLWNLNDFIVSRQKIFHYSFSAPHALHALSEKSIDLHLCTRTAAWKKSLENLKSLFKNNKCALVLILRCLHNENELIDFLDFHHCKNGESNSNHWKN